MGTPKVRSTCAWLAACTSGVNENSSLCIVAVDHRQPQQWIKKLALALVRSQACKKTTHVSIRNDGMRAPVARRSAVATV